MKTYIFSILLALFYFFIHSCSSSNLKKRAELVIVKSGNNKFELNKVIEHYKLSNDKLKLKAAYFLIANMADKHSFESDFGNEVWKISDFVLKSNTITTRSQFDTQVKFAIDSFAVASGGMSSAKTFRLNDINSISSSFLISNIELAFKVWELPWASHVSFEEFCEYILPYRIKNEPLSDWRSFFYDKFISFQDSVQDKTDPKQMVEVLSNYLYKEWTHLENLNSFGFFPSLLMMGKIMGGTCDHRYFLVTAIMRSVGLPVSIDFTPQWTNYTGGHGWNVLLDNNGRMRPFNGGEDNFRFYDKNLIPMGSGESICTKVYRKMFSSQVDSKDKVSAPFAFTSFFSNTNLVDVTKDYDFPNTRLVIDVDGDLPEGQVVFLLTFNYGEQINIVGKSFVNNGKADFGYVGLPAFYLPIVYEYSTPRLICKPLVMYKEKEKRHVYKPNLGSKRSVRLYRKFAFSGEFLKYADDLIGGEFQVSDFPDFSDFESVGKIDFRAKGFEQIPLNCQRTYRYIRFKSSNHADVRLAELEFWGKEKKSEEQKKLSGNIIGQTFSGVSDDESLFLNAFDGDIRTNFDAKAGSWIGLDLGNNYWVPEKVWFLPRNNFNVIEEGHLYELFYFSDRWVSLGKKYGERYFLDWDGVPDQSLLLLKNHTEGRQERIFMYDNDTQEQVWW